MVVRAGLLLSVAFFSGCGDDNAGEGVFDCPNCAHWTKLIRGNINNPSYKPGSTSIVAFNSDRGNTSNDENIWIVELNGEGEEDDAFHQVTESANDEFDPSWSPDGGRLAYTATVMDEQGRPGYELFLVHVEDFDNPGDALRLTNTDFSDEAIVSKPSSSQWLDDDTVLFSDGQNIYILTLDGDDPGTRTKIVNDPSDFISSGTDDFIENQAAGMKADGGELVFFVSDSRVPLGSIEVAAHDEESGDTVHAEIHLEGVPTGVMTPAVVGGRPLGTYIVGASVTDEDAEEDYCDTLLSEPLAVFENDTTEAEFAFSNPRGAIRLLARPLNANFFYDGIKQVSIRSDTTWIECVYPGLHEVKIVAIEARDDEGNFLRDSLWATIAERETLTIDLDVTGEEPGKRTLAAGTTSLRPRRAEASPSKLLHGEGQVLWQFDSRDGSYRAISAEGETPAYPAVDPTGAYLAYVVDFAGLKIVNLSDGTFKWISLPGATGVNICYREAAYPSWSSDGSRIVLSLTPCTDQPSSDSNSPEHDAWEVDVGSFLTP
jgi:hypothetical protein